MGVTLVIVQLALLLHVRNTIHDAAIEGARRASLVGEDLASGVRLTRGLIDMAIGEAYSRDISAVVSRNSGAPVSVVTVRAPFPALGMWGPSGWLVVEGRAPIETLTGAS